MRRALKWGLSVLAVFLVLGCGPCMVRLDGDGHMLRVGGGAIYGTWFVESPLRWDVLAVDCFLGWPAGPLVYSAILGGFVRSAAVGLWPWMALSVLAALRLWQLDPQPIRTWSWRVGGAWFLAVLATIPLFLWYWSLHWNLFLNTTGGTGVLLANGSVAVGADAPRQDSMLVFLDRATRGEGVSWRNRFGFRLPRFGGRSWIIPLWTPLALVACLATGLSLGARQKDSGVP